MRKNKISAVILIIALLFNSIPFTVFSVDSQENINNVINDIVDNQIITEVDTTNNNDIYIVAEDVSKRTEFEKHYFCSDGTFTVVTYPEAVHYLDEIGNWVDIDNSLVLNTSSGLYETTNDNFTLSIAPIIDTQHLSVSSLNTTYSNIKEEQSNLISLVNGDNNLSWTLHAEKGSNQDSSLTAGDEIQRVSESSNKQTIFASASARIIGTIRSSEETNANNSDFIGKNPNDPNAFVLNKVSNSVEYDSIFGEDEGISVRYTISHNKIEEDIFFDKKTNIQSISMSVECGNLTPILNIDNSVDFIDQNGEMIYHISTPYMVDAAFETSNDIETTLTTNGKYCIITYILNLDWLNSDDRVYPVILDPSVTTNEYSSNVADTYVVENSTTNHSSEQELYLDCDYDSEGNSLKRKIVISFGDFPEIDPTMPIYSATVNFNVQYGPFSDLVFKLESVEGISYTVNQMTYARLSNATLTSIAYTNLPAGSTSFNFDITDYIDDLISDELSGMFALSFLNEDSDDYCYPIYSSESASTNLRPHLTIKYGYRLPEDLSNGQSIIIQNYAHGGFLHSNYANNYNVYMKSFSSAANVDTNGTFTIVQNSTTGGYTFCNATNTSNKITADSSNNVSLSISGTASQNEWLIVPESVSEFRIVLRSDMSKALTAVGSATDGGSDTSLTAIGNVIVQDITFGSNGDNWDTSQQWTFYTSDGTMINPNYPFVDVSSGEYYLNNTETGKFLYVDSNTVTAHSALTKANISLENAKWYITNLGDNTYTIQNANNLNEFLAIKTDGSTLELSSFYGASTTEIPDRYIWKINWNASQSGCILVNQTYSKRIYATDSGVATETSPASITNICLWRICPTYSYVPVTASNVLFKKLTIDVGDIVIPNISKSENVNLATYKDFIYTVLETGSNYVSVDNITKTFTGVTPGTARIRATHKITGISFEFDIKVNKSAIIIVPGFGGSELYIGANNPHFYYGTPLFTERVVDSILNVDYTMYFDWTKDTYNAIDTSLYIVDALMCDNEGNSNSDVYVKEYDPNCSATSLAYTNQCGTFDVYKDLYDDLVYDYPNDIVKFFSYDWRMSCEYNAQKLHEFITLNDFDKVQFVSHSMGGLVTAAYLSYVYSEELQIQIGENFFLGSPLFGSLEAVHIIASETIDNFFEISPTTTNEKITYALLKLVLECGLDYLTLNWESVYDLLPSEEYFRDSTYDAVKYNGVSVSYSNFSQKLASAINSFDLDLYNASVQRRNSMYHNSTYITNLYSSKYYFGSGAETTVTVNIIHNLLSTTSEATRAYAGDGLVMPWSAYPSGTATDKKTDYANTGHMALIDAFINPSE